jgi:hypothetical protein
LTASALPAEWNAFATRIEKHRREALFYRDLAAYLEALPGPVLCQLGDVGLRCSNSILMDTFYFSSMADAGAFDDTTLIDEIRNGRLAAIVMQSKRLARLGSTWSINLRWIDASADRYRRIHVPHLKRAAIFLPLKQAE